MPNFSLVKAINETISKSKPSPENKEVLERGLNQSKKIENRLAGSFFVPFDTELEQRDVTYALNTGAVASNKINLIDAIRANLVSVQAGAILLNNLAGDNAIVGYGGSSVQWAGSENSSATASDGLFSSVLMKSRRLTGKIDVSNQLLMQSSIDVEKMISDDFGLAIAAALEAAIFSKAASVTNIPDGLYTGVGDAQLAVKGTASFANVLTLEKTLNSANAPLKNRCYVTTPTGLNILKSTPKVASQAIMICENNMVNGYPIFQTNFAPNALATGANEEALLFCSMSDLIIGTWGPIAVTVDPFTKADQFKTVITINILADIVKKRSISFACGSLK